MDYINWIVSHYGELSAAFLSFLAFASIVVKFTPSTKDDAFVAWLIDFLSNFSVANKKDHVEVHKDEVATETDARG